MSEEFEFDTDIDALEAKDTARALPLGWLILFWGLILFGIVYFVLYSPITTGWTQAGEYEESLEE